MILFLCLKQCIRTQIDLGSAYNGLCSDMKPVMSKMPKDIYIKVHFSHYMKTALIEGLSGLESIKDIEIKTT